MESERGERPDASRVDEVAASYLDRLNAGESLDPLSILAEHPDIGADVIDRLEAFVDIGGTSGETWDRGTLGDYTLRRRIGRGGMGVVYEAWQASLDRRVALKVLPAGLAADTKACSRFLREAQVAAKLNHPSVVPVHGFGVESGTPYFAMDFVEGETVAQIVASMKAAPPDAPTPFGASREEQEFYLRVARAFADVADGLQHAHSRGVIHRDIKPSNLILERAGDGGEAAPARLRILDFGLARLEGQESLSASGDVVGTPLYMSPEQARRRKIPVDHRTDVYSLGATLYEVLALEPPFRGKDHDDTLWQIVSRDPRPPRLLSPRVPRDLETIVLRCMRKEPGDRYGTAEALAQDLRRFVRGDPIEARPQSRWERWSHRLWRHRVALGVAALLLVSVASVLVIAGLLVWREKVRAEGALREAMSQRERADRHFAYARGAVNEMLTEVGESELKDVPGMENVRRALLEKALGFYRKFVEEKESEPESRRELGEAELRLGDILDMLGRSAEAEAAYREAVAVFERSGGDPRQDLDSVRSLGQAHRSLAQILAKAGRAEEAKAAFAQASARFEAVIAESLDDRASLGEFATTLRESGKLLENEGKYDDAERAYRRAIDLWAKLLKADPKDLAAATAQAACLRKMSKVLSKTGDMDGAQRVIENLKQALSALESMDEQVRKRPECRIEIVALLHTLVISPLSKGKPGEAEAAERKALAIQRELAADFPHVPDYRQGLAKACWALAEVDADCNEAAALFEESLRIYRQLANGFPEVPEYRAMLAGVLNNHGKWLMGRGEKEPAKATFRDAIAVSDQLARDFPAVPDYGNRLAMFRSNLATMLWQDGANAEALAEFEGALAELRRLGEAFPRVHEYQANQARLGNNIGVVLTTLGRLEDAEQAYLQAIAVQDGLVERFPQEVGYPDVLAKNLLNVGMLTVTLGRPDDAEKAISRGLGILREVVAADPGRAEHRWALAGYLDEVGATWLSIDRYAPAAEALRESLPHWDWLVNRSPADARFTFRHIQSMFRLTMAEWRLGRKEEALQSYQDADDSVDRYGLKDDALQRLRAKVQALLEGRDGKH